MRVTKNALYRVRHHGTGYEVECTACFLFFLSGMSSRQLYVQQVLLGLGISTEEFLQRFWRHSFWREIGVGWSRRHSFLLLFTVTSCFYMLFA